jgi:putative ABC transport system permease protein
MLKAALRSLLSRKLRLVLSGLAVVLGVMFVSGAFVLTDTLGRTFDNLFAGVYANTDVEVTGEPKIAVSELEGEEVPANLPASLVGVVRQVPGVAEAYGQVTADGARVIGADGKVVSTGGPPQFGMNWYDDPLLELREGHVPQADDQVALNAALAKAAKLTVGDRVAILTPFGRKQTFELVGVFGIQGGKDSLGGTHMVAFTEPVAQRLMLGEPDVYSSVTVRAAPGVSPSELRDRIRAELGDGYRVRTGEEAAAAQAGSFREFLSFFNNILLGFAGVALFVGVFLIVNTFSIIVAQRTRELALLRAIGASRRQVVGSVLLEALLIGLVASAVGLGAGIGVGALLARVVAAFGGGLDLAGLGVPATAVIGAFGVGIPVTLLAALLPAVRASRIPPVAALQEAATPDRPLTRLTVTGGVVFAAGVALLVVGLRGAGDATLWMVLAGVLVTFTGVALLTPAIARPVVGAIGRLFSWSVPGRLGRLNSGRNPRRTAITAAALMVGIALITGVSTVLVSATKSLERVLTEKVYADLIISGEQAGPRPPTFDPAVLDRVAALPGVRAVAGQAFDVALVNGARTGVSATSDLAALRQIVSLRPTAGSLDGLAAGQVVVDAKTAAAAEVTAGDVVTVQLARGEPRTFTVRGVYAEHELVSGWLISAADGRDLTVSQPMMALIDVTDGADVAGVRDQVAALLADSPEVSVADRSDFIAQQTSSVDSILLMVQILLALAILIAVLGIVNTLALSVLERTRELGLLRAIGLDRGQTMRMVTVEAVVIAVFGALLGVVVGAGLGAAVVRALEEQGISDLALPWTQMATYLVLAGVVGVLAAVLPAIRAARTNVLRAIAYE